jgi:hypothetical protein
MKYTRTVLLDTVYLDCVQTSAPDDGCYDRWRRSCVSYFGDFYCDLLEQEAFPATLYGEESC